MNMLTFIIKIVQKKTKFVKIARQQMEGRGSEKLVSKIQSSKLYIFKKK